MHLQRKIGVLGLTMIGVGGVIGSGWLFALMNAAQQAGPAAILSWATCGAAILLIALTYAEVCARLPVAWDGCRTSRMGAWWPLRWAGPHGLAS